VDLFDIFAFVPLPGERGLERRPRNEQVAAMAAIFGLPMIEIAITVARHVTDPQLLCVTLPLAFGVLAYLVCRLLGARVGFSLWLSVGCAAMCFCWGVFAVILTLMTWGY
jgi:hypothetical protein